MWCVHFLGKHSLASMATKHQSFLSLTDLVCKITSPKKGVKIQHLLHLSRVPRVESQKWRGFFSPNDKWNINTTVNCTCAFHNLSPFVLSIH